MIKYEKTIFQQPLVPIPPEVLRSNKHQSIVAITSQDGRKYTVVGSGILISNNIVLTSAHNIYDRQKHIYYNSFKVYCHNQNGVGTNPVEVEGWRLAQSYKTSRNQDETLKNDYALFKLKTPIIQEAFIPLHQSCDICLMNKNSQTEIDIVGYPYVNQNYKPSTDNTIHLTQYGRSIKNRICFLDSAMGKIGYAISTQPGHSGSPVSIGNKIIAVHSSSHLSREQNLGRLITKDLLVDLRQWCIQLNGSQFVIDNSQLCHHKEKYLKDQQQKQALLGQQTRKQKEIEQLKQKIRQANKQLRIKQINSKGVNSLFQSCYGFALSVDINGEIMYQHKHQDIKEWKGWNLQQTQGHQYFIKTHQYDAKFKLAISYTDHLLTTKNAERNGWEEFQLNYTQNQLQPNKTSFELTIRKVASPRMYLACNQSGILYARPNLTNDCLWTQKF